MYVHVFWCVVYDQLKLFRTVRCGSIVGPGLPPHSFEKRYACCCQRSRWKVRLTIVAFSRAADLVGPGFLLLSPSTRPRLMLLEAAECLKSRAACPIQCCLGVPLLLHSSSRAASSCSLSLAWRARTSSFRSLQHAFVLPSHFSLQKFPQPSALNICCNRSLKHQLQDSAQVMLLATGHLLLCVLSLTLYLTFISSRDNFF